jgi:hypothetical protein
MNILEQRKISYHCRETNRNEAFLDEKKIYFCLSCHALYDCREVMTFVAFTELINLLIGLTAGLELQMNDLLRANLQIFGFVFSPCKSGTRDRLAKNNLEVYSAKCVTSAQCYCVKTANQFTEFRLEHNC